jgi:hypothetical protein
MPDHDSYEAWKRRRAEIPVSDDFADRVMASLYLREQRPARQFARMVRVLVGWQAFRFGVCSLACIAGLLRVLQIVVLFLAEQSSR